jgi:hypothetical protein
MGPSLEPGFPHRGNVGVWAGTDSASQDGRFPVNPLG